jgi:hypothetical protein
MPKRLHEALERQAMKKFGSTTSERARQFIYGIMNRVEKGKKKPK